MESVVNSLIEDSDQNIDFDECVNEGVEECNLTKSYPCGLCSKVCKSKGGLTLHSRAKHGEKAAVTKTVSPLTSEVVTDIVDKAAKSLNPNCMANQCLHCLSKLTQSRPKIL